MEEMSESKPSIVTNENTMLCPDCGQIISKRAVSCPHCGCPIQKMQKSENESSLTNHAQEEPEKKKHGWKTILVIMIVVLAVVIIPQIQKRHLENVLESAKWYSFDGNGNELYLEFENGKIEYSGDFGTHLSNQRIATINYEIVGSNTIKVRGEDINVSVNEGYVVFTPSFIDGEESSLWCK